MTPDVLPGQSQEIGATRAYRPVWTDSALDCWPLRWPPPAIGGTAPAPEPTKTSLRQRLSGNARSRWPDLAAEGERVPEVLAARPPQPNRRGLVVSGACAKAAPAGDRPRHPPTLASVAVATTPRRIRRRRHDNALGNGPARQSGEETRPPLRAGPD